MWIYWILVIMTGTLLVVSAGIEVAEEIPWYRRPFQKSARFLAEKMRKKKSGMDMEKEAAKLETMLICLCVGLAVLPVLEGTEGKEEIPLVSYRLQRPEKGEGTSSYDLQAEIQDREEAEEVRLDLEERKYSEEEKEALLKRAMEEIDQIVPGENNTPDEVRGKIELPSELQNGEVSVQWIQNPNGLIDETGKIQEGLTEKGAILTLTAMLTCEEQETFYEIALHLYPEIRTGEEQIKHDLQQALNQAKEESQEKKELLLPEQVNGKTVTWTEKKTSMMWLWLILVAGLAVAGYAGKAEEMKKMEEQKRRQLILDYPDVVFKMGMLLNAGLTIQNAFTKIAEEYQETKGKGTVRWAYEEMVITCNEMKSGIAEARAYERFGRRCEQTCYVRLGSMLSGGLQKSSEGMTDLLLQESEEAMEERRKLARKMGEEAGTKLLFPMILMLMVVLVILIVPAVLAF